MIMQLIIVGKYETIYVYVYVLFVKQPLINDSSTDYF